MNQKPLLSVALITYNQQEFIAECLESMVNQETNFPFEIVIGEDCSTDDTRTICQQYKDKYPDLIRLAFPNNNLGMMGNWIHTINSCAGKYIAICEGDDYWIDKKKLQKQVDFLEANEDYALCSTASQLLAHMYGHYYNVEVKKETLTTKDILEDNWGIMTATIVFRKDALEMPEWFSKVKNGDYSLQLLVSLKGKIKCLSDYTSVYRQHVGGVSNSLTAFNQATWLIYLLWEFNEQTKAEFQKEIVTKIKRVYRNQLRFAKENKLRKAYWKLRIFQILSSVSPFLIKNYRK